MLTVQTGVAILASVSEGGPTMLHPNSQLECPDDAIGGLYTYSKWISCERLLGRSECGGTGVGAPGKPCWKLTPSISV